MIPIHRLLVNLYSDETSGIRDRVLFSWCILLDLLLHEEASREGIKELKIDSRQQYAMQPVNSTLIP